MKRFPLFIAALFCAVAFSSCEDDMDPPDIPLNSYVGVVKTNVFTSQEFIDKVLSDMDEESYGPEAVASYKAKLESLYNGYVSTLPSDTKAITSVCFKTFDIEYTTKNERGEDVTASALVAMPYQKKLIGGKYLSPSYIDLDCHYTYTADFQRPTASPTPTVGLALSGAMVVCPDYIGFGSSADQTEPYLLHEVTAKNCIDALLAALEVIKAEGIEMTPGYYTQITGFSEGASVALACHKAIEAGYRDCADKVNLKGSYCGDGPYDIATLFPFYQQAGTVPGPYVVPLLIRGMINGHPEQMAGLKLSDYMSEKFNQSNLLSVLDSKKIENFASVALYTLKGLNKYDALLSEAFVNPENENYTRLHSALDAAMAKEDLTTGWSPVAPVKLFHSEEDDTVPFAVAQTAAQNLGCELETISSGSHLVAQIAYYAKVLEAGLFD